MHLNDEQFEEALAGQEIHAEHLSACAECRRRLQAHRDMRGRLRQAFSTAVAPADLVERVRRDLGKPKAKPLLIRWMPAWAAAAAVVILAIPLIVISTSATDTQAAQLQLAQIHEMNIVGMKTPGQFYSEDDPAKLAAYFKDKLHFSPAMPKPGQGLAMRGCCVAHFGKGVAGSYVVQTTPSGLISIIVVRTQPRDLGLKDTIDRDGKTYFRGAYAKCNLVTVRLGDYTYCAVANNDVHPDKLVDLLERLVN